MGLNSYLYAPKDDYKHRLFWREKYSADESGESGYFLLFLSIYFVINFRNYFMRRALQYC